MSKKPALPPAPKTGYTTYKAEPPCHTDGTLIFIKDGTEFYAGKYSGVNKRSYDLIIDLAKMVTATVSSTNPRGKIKEFADGLSVQILHISWPDYGIITWEKERFQELLAAIKADKLESVYVCCVGGHGRTGTMMSILAGLSNAIPDGECPVTWLRNKYCDNVVESESQLDYVQKITGLTVTADPGKSYGAYTRTTYNNPSYNTPKVTGPLYDNDWQYGHDWREKVYGGKRGEYDGKYSNPN
jgi:hypothetical protein